MNDAKRRQNERKFGQWESLPTGGRRYWYDVPGRYGWRARYVKEVDDLDHTTRFYQQIFNADGQLVEVHEKYPVDKGHQSIDIGEQEESNGHHK